MAKKNTASTNSKKSAENGHAGGSKASGSHRWLLICCVVVPIVAAGIMCFVNASANAAKPAATATKASKMDDVPYNTKIFSWSLQLQKLAALADTLTGRATHEVQPKSMPAVATRELDRIAADFGQATDLHEKTVALRREADRLEAEIASASPRDRERLRQGVLAIRFVLDQGQEGAAGEQRSELDQQRPTLEIAIPSSPSVQAHWKEVDSSIESHWQRLQQKGAYGIPDEEADAIEAAAKRTVKSNDEYTAASTYGEVLPAGFRRLGYAMGIAGDKGKVTAPGSVVFMDMGSGTGRLVAQAYLDWPSVKQSIGIELSATRTNVARLAWSNMEKSGRVAELRQKAHALLGSSGSDAASAVQFLQEDLLQTDVSAITHAYIASALFPKSMLQQLADKLSSEAKHLCKVASLKQLPFNSEEFHYDGSAGAEMTWSSELSAVHLYSKIGKTC